MELIVGKEYWYCGEAYIKHRTKSKIFYRNYAPRKTTVCSIKETKVFLDLSFNIYQSINTYNYNEYLFETQEEAEKKYQEHLEKEIEIIRTETEKIIEGIRRRKRK